jgi:DNA-binding transcriptional regulator GbsR (MarR family)
VKKKTPQKKPPRLPVPVKQFIETVGQFIEYWGFMRLQGEMWALVFISEKPITAVEMANLLGVSKASISLALRELIDYQVLFFDTQSGKRNQPLVANENLGEVIAGVIRLREMQMLNQARLGLSALQSPQRTGFALNDKRIKTIETLLDGAQGVLHAFVRP